MSTHAGDVFVHYIHLPNFQTRPCGSAAGCSCTMRVGISAGWLCEQMPAPQCYFEGTISAHMYQKKEQIHKNK